jgi:hypothetical protein
MNIRSTLAITLALAASVARADTIDVDSTTFLNVARQLRGGVPGQSFDLATTAPAFEILSLSVRDMDLGAVQDARIVLRTWGAVDIKDRRWDNGTDSKLTGDINAGYLEGKLFARHLTLRLGRTLVSTGVARTLQVDGGEAVVVLPGGFRLSGYAGVPVTQRFGTRSSLVSWNPVGGDFAGGGRLGWSLALPGEAGRGLDVGASINEVKDHGDPVREELGFDLRLKPVNALVLSAFDAYSLYDKRTAEASVRVGLNATRALLVEVDYRYVVPDLLLARNSILSVFSAEERQTVGLGATWAVNRAWKLGGSYHLVVEPDRESGKAIGNEADAKIEWARGVTAAGLEGFWLDAVDNGYVGGRLFARREFGPAFAAVDLLLHEFREKVNNESRAFTGSLSLGYELLHGLSAVVSGQAGVTPFMEQTFEVMAKLVYNQTYRKTEVR